MLILSVPQDYSGRELLHVKWSEVLTCSIPSFYEPQPITVGGERGVLENEVGGIWPEGTQPVIELVGRGQTSRRFVIRASVPSGTISFSGVAAGEYFFRAGEKHGGWGCISGIVELPQNPQKTSKSVVRIEIPLGR